MELLSGTRQRAKLMGIENDTVSLGGYIQNKFTIVKIAKKQFKRIVDEKGNDLLATSSSAAKHSTASSSSAKPAPISSAAISSSSQKIVPTSSSSITSSAASSSSSAKVAPVSSSSAEKPVEKPATKPVKTVLVAYNGEGVEQSVVDQFTGLTARLLMESGEHPQVIRKSDIKNCNDNICMQNQLAAYGFRSIYFGEIVPNIKTDSLTLNLTHASRCCTGLA